MSCEHAVMIVELWSCAERSLPISPRVTGGAHPDTATRLVYKKDHDDDDDDDDDDEDDDDDDDDDDDEGDDLDGNLQLKVLGEIVRLGDILLWFGI